MSSTASCALDRRFRFADGILYADCFQCAEFVTFPDKVAFLDKDFFDAFGNLECQIDLTDIHIAVKFKRPGFVSDPVFNKIEPGSGKRNCDKD